MPGLAKKYNCKWILVTLFKNASVVIQSGQRGVNQHLIGGASQHNKREVDSVAVGVGGSLSLHEAAKTE